MSYQAAPCSSNAKQKVVDTTDKNRELGRDLAANAKRDKAKLQAKDKARAHQAASPTSAAASSERPQLRNLAIENIERAAEKLKPQPKP